MTNPNWIRLSTARPGTADVVQRKCSACAAEQTNEQQAGSDRRGAPMADDVRARMEGAFGRDFSSVRIHEDSRANAIGALAYTRGEDIHFAAGHWQPHSQAGQELLGHELAHVVQQSQGRVRATTQAKGAAINDDPTLEREADRAGAQVARGEPATGLQGKPLPKPNKAPGCDEVCGDETKCTRSSEEQCTGDEDKKIFAAWQKAAANVANAAAEMGKSPLSAAVTQALKDNFNWSPGNSPKDLPQKVAANLDDATAKTATNLCVRCYKDPCAGEARIHQARGVNCTGHNCFDICRSKFFDSKFTAKGQAHALAHELMHRVITQGPVEYYRGEQTYPPPPTIALNNADSYASLVDDLNP